VPKADMLTDVVSKIKACYPRKRTFGSRDWNVILKTRRKSCDDRLGRECPTGRPAFTDLLTL
jgi:hypothetical protein